MPANRVLVTVPHIYDRDAPYLRRLESAGFEVVRRIGKNGKLTEDELIEALPATYATVAASEPYTERVFRSARALRVVARWGVGFDAIDVAAATRHGVAVCTAVGGNHEAVADYAFALMAALQRGLQANTSMVVQGVWRTKFRPGIWRATVGIVGLGRIGKAVARRCRGFDMRILATEPAPDPAFVREYGIQLLPLQRLLGEADLVTLHCPLSPETRHLIDREHLALMKPTAYLVNTARGPIVDEAALYEALASGRIAGAGLDVFEVEPLASSPLVALDNVLLSPHIAGVDLTSEAGMADRAIDAILAVRAGRSPAGECLLNPESLAVGRGRLTEERPRWP